VKTAEWKTRMLYAGTLTALTLSGVTLRDPVVASAQELTCICTGGTDIGDGFCQNITGNPSAACDVGGCQVVNNGSCNVNDVPGPCDSMCSNPIPP